jgi:hypothetical protein
MPAPGVFADVQKTADDLLTKQYIFDTKLTMKAVTAGGLTFNAENKTTKGVTYGNFSYKFKPLKVFFILFKKNENILWKYKQDSIYFV